MSRYSELCRNGPVRTDAVLSSLSRNVGDDIDPLELVSVHAKRRKYRQAIYERFYRKCCERIRYANDVQYVRECFFEVPEIVLWEGIPRYEVSAVIAYIMLRLHDKGFDVRFKPPNGVFVNWTRLVREHGGKTAAETTVVRYELDEKSTKAERHVATPAQQILHKGCAGQCCKAGAQKPKAASRKSRLERERRRQQEEIDRLVREREGR